MLNGTKQQTERANTDYILWNRNFLNMLSERKSKEELRNPKTKFSAQRRFIYHTGTEGRG